MNAHDLDLLSLLTGVAFAVLGLVFLFTQVDVTQLRWDWVWPASAIAVGAAVLVQTRRRVSSQQPEIDGG